MLTSYLRVGGCRGEKCVDGCREESCVSLLPRCGWVSGEEMCCPCTYVWVGVGRRNVLASYVRVGGCLGRNVLTSYLRVGGCRGEKCVCLVPTCGGVSGGGKCVSLVTICGWMSGGGMC